MRKNNNLRVAISKDFDKANNLKEIKERIEESNKMKNKNIIFKYAGGICCVALIVMGFILLNGKNDTKKIFDNGKDVMYINPAKKDLISSDMDIKILNPDETTNDFFKGLDTNYLEIKENLDKDYPFINDLKIPSDLNNIKKLIVLTKENKDDSDYRIINNYQLIYNDSNNKKITISFSKNYEPLRDYLIESDNNKESNINNTKLTIHQFEQTYMTRFKYNNINFDIETRNITENEFISLLQSIIK